MLKIRLRALLLIATMAAVPCGTALADMAKPADEVVRVAALTRTELKQAVHAESTKVRHKKPGRIWCVPFARAVSGIEIRGDAATWWKKAGADYPKGQVPVPGSVLNFRATNRMPRGHVAVVSGIVSERKILVDQANWVTNRITQDTLVIDVSKDNDWSAVRVANQSNSFGRVYPTYGFIYRPQQAGL